MPLPQVNDRLKEIPAQALRTLFATIGQLLLVAERFRTRAAEQLSGGGEATKAAPPDRAPAAAPRPRTTPAARDTGDARWRSLDKTGNVRVLDGDEELDEEDLGGTRTPAGAASGITAPGTTDPGTTPSGPSFEEPATPADPEVAAPPARGSATPAVPEPATPAVPEPATLAVPEPATPAVPEPATPAVPDPATLAVPEPATPAVPEPATPAIPEPAIPEPAILEPVAEAAPEPVPAAAEYTPTEPVPAVPVLAEPVPVESAPPTESAGEALPVPNYDQLTVASLRARLRVLDAGQVQVLLDYEKAHEGRPAVITMFERRLTKLGDGS